MLLLQPKLENTEMEGWSKNKDLLRIELKTGQLTTALRCYTAAKSNAATYETLTNPSDNDINKVPNKSPSALNTHNKNTELGP